MTGNIVDNITDRGWQSTARCHLEYVRMTDVKVSVAKNMEIENG